MIAAMYEGQLAAAARGSRRPRRDRRGRRGRGAGAAARRTDRLRRSRHVRAHRRAGRQPSCRQPYDWPDDRLVFAMAGGLDALVRSAEGAEDNEAAGAQAMTDAKIGANDVVIGIAASGTTPFTIGALAGAPAPRAR